MKTLKFVIAFVVAVVIAVLCVANAGEVVVYLWPDVTDYGLPAAPRIGVPVFIVGLIAGLAGFLLGAAREWAREGRIRSSARIAKREAAALKSKVDEMTADQGDDDIPALPSR
ncbi:MAG: LapA family protein [Pseudomonadota bacterium]